MPSVFSKEFQQGIKQLFLQNNQRKVISASVLAIILYLVKARLTRDPIGISPKKIPRRRQGQGNVDRMFWKRLWELTKIVIPSWRCMEVLNLALLSVFLIARTMLSIYIATLNGRIVKTIIERDLTQFIKRILQLAMIAVPASFVNSYLDYLNKILGLSYRSKLTNYFHEQYVKNMIFYQLSNLDSRVSNPDQRLTSDIEKWASSFSVIYSNFTKPVFDIILFSKKLAELIGPRGPIYVFLWYFASGLVLKFVSPPFGKMTAIDQKYEGEYRHVQSQLVYHAEEVAFYRGHDWEKKQINESFSTLIGHQKKMNQLRLYMGVFDGILVKYGSVMAGYGIMGLPVFGANKDNYLKLVGSDKSAITRDYIRNSSLLINLAKAIGRLVISYKEIQQLAGYTKVVYEIKEVLEDLTNGQFKRIQVTTSKEKSSGRKLSDSEDKQKIIALDKGKLVETQDVIEFNKVPIVSPNGDTLVAEMSFKITPGMNCVISGPNGCGKSSLFRILGGLWPISGGVLNRPAIEKLFYIPQRPYLPPGTLRDQIIYPHHKINMLRNKVKDEHLTQLLEEVQLGYLVSREGGLNAENDWNDILSGGEKQRIAMARLFYHKPLFAILDECTSSVSMDVEAIMYNMAKKLQITLFTVSHRTSLFKYHEYMLKFDGEGGYIFKPNIVEHH